MKDFSTALYAMKSGLKVSRHGWNGKGMWVAIQYPDANSKMTRPYFFLKTIDDQFVPWLPSQSDILATDWAILSDEE